MRAFCVSGARGGNATSPPLGCGALLVRHCAVVVVVLSWCWLRDSRGVIPRVIDAVYDRASRAGDLTSPLWVVRASYLELYREDIRDLLAPDTPPKVWRPRARAACGGGVGVVQGSLLLAASRGVLHLAQACVCLCAQRCALLPAHIPHPSLWRPRA